MKYLKITSKGEIEVYALKLVGASTKRGDSSKIGMFGSGSKYALASMLRNKVNFKIFSGEEEIKVGTKKADFRDKKFEVITLNGEETSLTTDMGGLEWNNSFSFLREVYSNALDEDENATFTITKEIKGSKGETSFYIQLTEDVKEFFENIGKYFSRYREDMLAYTSKGSVYPSPDKTLRLYRKGIMCKESEKDRALYSYDSELFKINESRVLSSDWDARYIISHLWQECEEEDLIRDFIMGLHGGNAGFYEHSLTFYDNSFSKAWKKVLSEMKFVSIEHLELFDETELKGRIQLQFEWLKVFKSFYPELDLLGSSSSGEGMREVENPSSVLQNKVIDALGILYETDYAERLEEDLDIRYVKFTNSGILGLADNGRIYLSVKLSVYSEDEIARIIIEENEHNLTGFGDKTREFQDHLFSLYYDLLKRCSKNK